MQLENISQCSYIHIWPIDILCIYPCVYIYACVCIAYLWDFLLLERNPKKVISFNLCSLPSRIQIRCSFSSRNTLKSGKNENFRITGDFQCLPTKIDTEFGLYRKSK